MSKIHYFGFVSKLLIISKLKITIKELLEKNAIPAGVPLAVNVKKSLTCSVFASNPECCFNFLKFNPVLSHPRTVGTTQFTAHQTTYLRMSNLDTQFSLPSDPNQVEKVQPFVDEVAQRYSLSSDTQGNILVSLTEAVTNAMLHGNRGDCSKKVSISLHRHKDSLEVRVSDQGAGFDPAAVPDPTSDECIEVCGGRGLYLMRQLSDECRFMQNGRTVAMRFNI